eukprot:3969824-Amphidinium_carterae.1
MACWCLSHQGEALQAQCAGQWRDSCIPFCEECGVIEDMIHITKECQCRVFRTGLVELRNRLSGEKWISVQKFQKQVATMLVWSDVETWKRSFSGWCRAGSLASSSRPLGLLRRSILKRGSVPNCRSV